MSFKNYNFRSLEEEEEEDEERADRDESGVTDIEMENDTMFCDVRSRHRAEDYRRGRGGGQRGGQQGGEEGGSEHGTLSYRQHRRHSDHDGNREERKSLLYERGDNVRVGASTGNIVTLIINNTQAQELTDAQVEINTQINHHSNSPLSLHSIKPHKQSMSRSQQPRDAISASISTSTTSASTSSAPAATSAISSALNSASASAASKGSDVAASRSMDCLQVPERGVRTSSSDGSLSRKRVLQRELQRIQNELKALGELEIEVSYV